MSRLFRFADLIAHKYKFAAEASELEKKEADIRREIVILWNVASEKPELNGALSPYADILQKLFSAPLEGEPEDDIEERALQAQLLIRHVLGILDYLKVRAKSIDFLDLRGKLVELREAIKKEMVPGVRNSIDFPKIGSLVDMMIRGNTKAARELYKKQQEPKATKGLIRIYELANKLLTKLNIFEGLPRSEDPTKEYRSNQEPRLTGQRAELSSYDIRDFLRQYATQYGIYNDEEWVQLVEHDKPFKEELTTLINALNRPGEPKNQEEIRQDIDKALENFRRRKLNNEAVLDSSEDQFRQVTRPRFVSPELKEELLERRRQLEQSKQEDQAKWDEVIRQRDEAHKRHSLENQPSEEEMKDKFSSLRMKQILKRYQ